MKKRILILAAFFLFVAKFIINLDSKKLTEAEDQEDSEVVIKKRPIKRAPASSPAIKQIQDNRLRYAASQKVESDYKSPGFADDIATDEQAIAESSQPSSSNSYASSSYSQSRRQRSPRSNERSNNGAESEGAQNTNFQTENEVPPNNTGVGLSSSGIIDQSNTGTVGGSSASTRLNDVNCQADIGGGSFSLPISVSITCSEASTIRYCLAENMCCDPSSGPIYSGPINIGQEAKSYCLSFVGDSISTSVESPVVDVSYTFNPNLPDLQVSHPKIVYQATQLAGLMKFTSSTFGQSRYSAGVVNLRSHDPGVSALNMTCDEIAEHHSAFISPSPVELLPLVNLGSYSPTQELQVYPGQPELTYGDNFVSTYIKDSAFQNQYACSTTKVTLADFTYFEGMPFNSVVAAGSTRVFAGSFTSIGFFEPDVSLPRAPAGSSSEPQAQVELRSGLLGIFY